jgi:hypothetical protein
MSCLMRWLRVAPGTDFCKTISWLSSCYCKQLRGSRSQRFKLNMELLVTTQVSSMHFRPSFVQWTLLFVAFILEFSNVWFGTFFLVPSASTPGSTDSCRSFHCYWTSGKEFANVERGLLYPEGKVNVKIGYKLSL